MRRAEESGEHGASRVGIERSLALGDRRVDHDKVPLEHLADSASHSVWREIGDDGRGTVVVIREELPPVRLVTDRVTEARGPSSEWTYAITRAPSGIDLTITERGTIPGTSQRFISQFTSGHAGPIERYLTQLAAYFDEPVRIR